MSLQIRSNIDSNIGGGTVNAVCFRHNSLPYDLTDHVVKAEMIKYIIDNEDTRIVTQMKSTTLDSYTHGGLGVEEFHGTIMYEADSNYSNEARVDTSNIDAHHYTYILTKHGINKNAIDVFVVEPPLQVAEALINSASISGTDMTVDYSIITSPNTKVTKHYIGVFLKTYADTKSETELLQQLMNNESSGMIQNMMRYDTTNLSESLTTFTGVIFSKAYDGSGSTVSSIDPANEYTVKVFAMKNGLDVRVSDGTEDISTVTESAYYRVLMGNWNAFMDGTGKVVTRPTLAELRALPGCVNSANTTYYKITVKSDENTTGINYVAANTSPDKIVFSSTRQSTWTLGGTSAGIIVGTQHSPGEWIILNLSDFVGHTNLKIIFDELYMNHCVDFAHIQKWVGTSSPSLWDVANANTSRRYIDTPLLTNTVQPGEPGTIQDVSPEPHPSDNHWVEVAHYDEDVSVEIGAYGEWGASARRLTTGTFIGVPISINPGISVGTINVLIPPVPIIPGFSGTNIPTFLPFHNLDGLTATNSQVNVNTGESGFDLKENNNTYTYDKSLNKSVLHLVYGIFQMSQWNVMYRDQFTLEITEPTRILFGSENSRFNTYTSLYLQNLFGVDASSIDTHEEYGYVALSLNAYVSWSSTIVPVGSYAMSNATNTSPYLDGNMNWMIMGLGYL